MRHIKFKKRIEEALDFHWVSRHAPALAIICVRKGDNGEEVPVSAVKYRDGKIILEF